MTARSKDLYIGQPAAGAVVAYTVPAGRVTIVRSWHAINGNAAAQNVFVTVVRGGVGVIEPPIGFPLASFASIICERWTVIAAGDQLVINSALIGVQFHASGAELIL